MRQVELRNGVLVIKDSQSPAATHLKLTRQELAAFVLGTHWVVVVAGAVAGAFLYLLMRSYVELVRVMSDMLIPK